MPAIEQPKIDYSAQTDEQLVALCKKGDELAFQDLMNRYVGQVFNFLRQYTRGSEDTEDIAQDTFFKAWRHIKKFETGRQFRPWLFTIARNTALDFIKKRKAVNFSDLDDAETEISFADTLADPEPLPPEIFENAELANILSANLKLLHPDHVAVLTLHYREDMTFDEIAIVMNRPMNTVKSWHRRAVERLRDLLAPHLSPLS